MVNRFVTAAARRPISRFRAMRSGSELSLPGSGAVLHAHDARDADDGPTITAGPPASDVMTLIAAMTRRTDPINPAPAEAAEVRFCHGNRAPQSLSVAVSPAKTAPHDEIVNRRTPNSRRNHHPRRARSSQVTIRWHFLASNSFSPTRAGNRNTN